MGTAQGVVRAYSIKRREPGQRWDREAIKGMVGTPQQPDPTKPGAKIPIRVNFDEAQGGEPVPSELPKDEAPVRRMRFNPSLLVKFGYTEGCPGCKMKKAGMDESRNHSEGCRERIMKELAKEEEGREKIRKEAEKLNKWVAENGEHADEAENPASGPDSREETTREAPEESGAEGTNEEEQIPEEAEEEEEVAAEGEQRAKRRNPEETEEERVAKRSKDTGVIQARRT